MSELRDIYRIYLLIIFLFTIGHPMIKADSQLYIDSVDTVSSGELFTVSVFDPSLKNMTPYLVNVLIIFNDKEYLITEEGNGEITITAPRVINNTTYLIEAYKEGYTPGFKNITITPAKYIHSKLVVTLDLFKVDANKGFLVIVTDEKGNPIEGATVKIKGFTGTETTNFTDKEGYTHLIAPDTDEITIIAQKEGYIDGIKKLMIVATTDESEDILHNQYTPLIIAAAILLLTIIYINFRERKPIFKGIEPKKSYAHPNLENEWKKNVVDENKNSSNSIKVENKSKVEEIHITKPRIEKKIVTIADEENFSWFNNNNVTQEKIDNLTTKFNKQDPWFEGIDEIRDKIDKKIKKYKKE